MSNTLPRLTSGIAGMDEILGGGFIEGAAYIVQGLPGSGKTIFAHEDMKVSGMMGMVTISSNIVVAVKQESAAQCGRLRERRFQASKHILWAERWQ